jgi:hypothetical protein
MAKLINTFFIGFTEIFRLPEGLLIPIGGFLYTVLGRGGGASPQDGCAPMKDAGVISSEGCVSLIYYI